MIRTWTVGYREFRQPGFHVLPAQELHVQIPYSLLNSLPQGGSCQSATTAPRVLLGAGG